MPLFARVSEGEVGIIERHGKYHKTVFPGKIYFLVPAIDALFVYNLKPKTYDLPKISILLKDSFTIDINIKMKYKIMEPYKARYDVENKDLEHSIERLIIKTMSSQLSEVTLEDAVASVPELTEKITKQVGNISKHWGFKLIFVEILNLKKSFLAEQERDKLYDVYKNERGKFMSEKVDSKDASKVIHSEEGIADVPDYEHLTDIIEAPNVGVMSEKINQKIEELEANLDISEDSEIKDLQLQQLEIYKEHQKEMLKLHEKDLVKQNEELMYEISKMAKKQEELLKKQQELVLRQTELEKSKKQLEETEKKELENTNVILQQLAEKDSLTNLFNRRCFDDEIVQRFEIAKNDKQPISVVLIDIDHFKQINDTYGHLAGDEALKLLGKILTNFVSEYDFVCRYGGEEFAIIHQPLSLKEVFDFVETIRKRIEMGSFMYKKKTINLTISAGIAIMTPEMNLTYKQLVENADKALYKAKNDGRNKTIIFGKS
ncbi:MAG: diguanylate cyclase [Cyanobacteriota bacterium]